MKKVLMIFFVAVLFFGSTGFLSADAFAAEWECRNGKDSSVQCVEEAYLLKNNDVPRGQNVLATHVSNDITLNTKIEMELELVDFSDSILYEDKILLKLITPSGSGLSLAFYNYKYINENNKVIFQRNIKTELYQDNELQLVLYEEEAINYTVSKNIFIKIEYIENAYSINFNSEKIELEADINKEEKAELSLELISGAPGQWDPSIKIISTALEFKGKGSGGSETEEGEQGQEKPGAPSKDKDRFLENKKIGNGGKKELYPVIIAVAAAGLIAGGIFLAIRQRKRLR